MATLQTATRTESTVEYVLDELGVKIVNSGREIRGYCPVHHLTVGREDRNPSWYMNSDTGAWLCFSCHAAGSLPSLVETLGGDVDGINDLIISNSAGRIMDAINRDEKEEEPAKPQEYVSAYAFSKNPYPPRRMMEDRDIDLDTCKSLNIRWDVEGRCFLLPVYTFEGGLLGWQEKATGYFNNYPKSMPKKLSLFGYQTLNSKSKVIVVESPLDAARFYRYGYKAVAIYGSYMSTEQADAIKKVVERGRSVVLAFDNDSAGADAAVHATSLLYGQRSIPVRYFDYGIDNDEADPGDLDVDELHLGVDKASPTMPRSIRRATERAKDKRKTNR